MMKPSAKIKDWYFQLHNNRTITLCGNMVDHPSKDLNGVHCKTSAIVRMDLPNGRVETLNTIYELVPDEN